MTMTSNITTVAARLHAGLEVRDVERAERFYRILFGAEPTKRRDGYARFEPAEPAVVLSLIEKAGPERPRRPADHFGIRLADAEAVERAAGRLMRAGLSVRREEQVACCYAVQTKAWVTDPDGMPWEIYAVLDDTAGTLAPTGDACCTEDCCT